MSMKYHQRVRYRSEHPDILALRRYVMQRIRDMQGISL
jgi:hypothetical protein